MLIARVILAILSEFYILFFPRIRDKCQYEEDYEVDN